MNYHTTELSSVVSIMIFACSFSLSRSFPKNFSKTIINKNRHMIWPILGRPHKLLYNMAHIIWLTSNARVIFDDLSTNFMAIFKYYFRSFSKSWCCSSDHVMGDCWMLELKLIVNLWLFEARGTTRWSICRVFQHILKIISLLMLFPHFHQSRSI